MSKLANDIAGDDHEMTDEIPEPVSGLASSRTGAREYNLARKQWGFDSIIAEAVDSDHLTRLENARTHEIVGYVNLTTDEIFYSRKVRGV